MTAYAYLRKSVSRDPKREVSYKVQESTIRALAARFGDNNGSLTLLSDWDKSGKLGRDKRHGYDQLLQAIESGKATAVYSYSLSRLGRSVPELSRLIADCTKRSIPVRLVADSIDTSTASGMLLGHVLMGLAQFESDIASERQHAANAAKVADGKSLRTVRVYGEVKKTRRGEVMGEDEDVPAVVAAFTEAGSFSGAARLLNERGVKPRNAKPRSIKLKVAGKIIERKQAIWWPSSVAVVIERVAPEFVPTRREQGVRASGSEFALRGLLRCPTCGTRLTGTRDRDGTRVRYSCRQGSTTPHQRVSISEHRIFPAIQAEVEAHLRLPGDQVAARERDKRTEAALEARLARLRDLYEMGDLSKDEYLTKRSAIQVELDALGDKQVVVTFPSIRETWELPPKDLNRVLRSVLKDIRLDLVTFQPVRYEPTVSEWWTTGLVEDGAPN